MRRLGVLRVAKNVDEETRFVIGDEKGSRTVNVMCALVSGIPVVGKEWVSYEFFSLPLKTLTIHFTLQ